MTLFIIKSFGEIAWNPVANYPHILQPTRSGIDSVPISYHIQFIMKE